MNKCFLWTVLNQQKQGKLELFLSQIWALMCKHMYHRYRMPHCGNTGWVRAGILRHSSNTYKDASISPEESSPNPSYPNGLVSTRFCVIWGNMSKAVGKWGWQWWWSKREEKQTRKPDFCSRIYPVWFAKMGDFDVNMYLWFYRSEKEPPTAATRKSQHTKTMDNCVCGLEKML